MRKEIKEEIDNSIEELKTIRKSLLDEQSKFITVDRFECILNNGKKVTREQILKNKINGDASIVLPITSDNKTIIVIQPRVFTKTTVGVSLPAGYKDDNETYLDAAKRELLEETGYVSDEIIKACSFYQDDGCSGAYNEGFIAKNAKKVSVQKLDKDEYIKYIEITLDELFELVELGYIKDVGSQLLIEKAKQNIK